MKARRFVLGLALLGARFAWRTFTKRRRGLKAHPWGPAQSAVTGGHPEEMNEMPPAEEPLREGPIYDGSQMRREKKSA